MAGKHDGATPHSLLQLHLRAGCSERGQGSRFERLCDSGLPFDAVADLCEMSARRDPAMARLAQDGAVKIAACFPRAVKWLFAAAQAPLPPDGAEILNMRTQTAEEIALALFDPEFKPNLPAAKVTADDAPAAPLPEAPPTS